MTRSDAAEARQIIQGLVVSSKQDVDLVRMDVGVDQIEALGEATGIESRAAD